MRCCNTLPEVNAINEYYISFVRSVRRQGLKFAECHLEFGNPCCKMDERMTLSWRANSTSFWLSLRLICRESRKIKKSIQKSEQKIVVPQTQLLNTVRVLKILPEMRIFCLNWLNRAV